MLHSLTKMELRVHCSNGDHSTYRLLVEKEGLQDVSKDTLQRFMTCLWTEVC
jgi:hypothetical protein